MNKTRFPAAVCIAIILGACTTEVDPVNPYDPSTPLDKRAKAGLSGRVDLEAYGDVTRVEILVAGLTGHPDAGGSFMIEGITPTVHEILFRLEGYEDLVTTRLFAPGDTLSVAVRLQVLRGAVIGTVQLEEENDHAGVTVEMAPAGAVTDDIDEEAFQLAALTTTNGGYVFDAVPVGTYALRASKDDYMGKVVPEVEVTAHATTQVPLIQLPPVTGAVTVLGGDPDQPDPFVNPDYPACCPNDRYTRTRDVLLRTEGFNAVRMKVAERREDLAGADWITYQTDLEHTLSVGDGPRTVFVLLEDEHGARSDVLEGHTVLDTQPPEVLDVLLGGGSGYTDDTGIAVTAVGEDLPAESGIAEMRLEVGAPPAEDAVWQPYVLRAPLILPEEDGAHQVFVEVRDRAGNRAEVASGTVRLDREPPRPVAGMDPVVVGNGSGFALGREVPVTLHVTDEVTPDEDLRMAVCRTEGCAGTGWSPFAPQTVMSFESGGSYTVYAVFRDGAGNTYAPEGVAFTIDDDAPSFPVVTVTEGPAVSEPDIHLQINATGADQMMIAEQTDFAGASWETFQSPVAYALGGTEGIHRVFVKVRDLAGHEVGPAMATVELDTTPPGGAVELVFLDPSAQCDGSTCYTNSESVLVEVSLDPGEDPGQVRMRLSLDETFNESAQAYSPYATVMLANQSGPQRVYLQLVDPAGNVSDTTGTSDAVVLDLVAPTVPVLATSPSGYAADNQGIVLAMITESQDDGSAIRGYEYQIESSGVTPWEPFDQDGDGQEIFDLPVCIDRDCMFHFKVRALDWAGNLGDHGVVSLVLDQQAPDLPRASVEAAPDMPGPREINAEAVTVWLTPPADPDPNFDEYETQVRTCQGEFDPQTFGCSPAGSWSAFSTWTGSGQGAGAIQLQVLLVGQDVAHHIEVRAIDRAGNASAADSVYFIEDSTPPSPAVMVPTLASVNADQVAVTIAEPAQDANTLAGYECTVNGRYACAPWDGAQYAAGGDSSDMDGATVRFRVALEQDARNVIQLRGRDAAGNYSGTSQSTITEDSTPLAASSFSATELRLGKTLRMDEVNALAIDEDTVVGSGWTVDQDGLNEGGLLSLDLTSGAYRWIPMDGTRRIEMKGGRAVVDVPLGYVCRAEHHDELVAGSPTGEAICTCMNDWADPACGQFDQALVDLIHGMHEEPPATLLLVDFSAGAPVRRWVHAPATPTATGVEHPLLINDEADRVQFSFDGRTLAWLESSAVLQDDQNRLYVTRLPDGCYDGGDCAMDHVLGRQFDGFRAGRVAVGGDFVTWSRRLNNELGEMWILDAASGTEELLDSGVAGEFNQIEKSDADFDCVWNRFANVPVCENLFWFGIDDASIALMSLDLADISAHRVDVLRYGLIELRSISAELGRVVWQDSRDGTADVFYLDLGDPQMCANPGQPGNRDCLGGERVLVGGAYRDTLPSLWGREVAYWRSTEVGYELRVADLGSYPWLFADDCLYGPAWISGGRVLAIRSNLQAPADPYQMVLFDPADGSMELLRQTDRLGLAMGHRSAGGVTSAGWIESRVDGYGAVYCDTQAADCQSGVVRLDQQSVPPYAGTFQLEMMRGDEERLAWWQIAPDTSERVLSVCHLDPAGTIPCQGGSGRVLLHADHPLALCDLGLGGAEAVLMLKNENTNDMAAYRIDLPALENLGAPLDLPGVDVPAGTPGFVEKLGAWNGYFRCGDISPRVALDAATGRAALIVSGQECTKCAGDDPRTLYREDCDQPPCCGQAPCDCATAGGCESWQDHHTVQVFPPPAGSPVVDGTFDDWPDRLALEDDWLVWVRMLHGQPEVFVMDLQSGDKRRMTFDPNEQNFPEIGVLPDDGIVPGGTQLLWTDSRLGPAILFHTLLTR